MSTATPKSSCRPTYDHRHFEQLHRTHSDPWAVLTSAYEREKYQATLQALAHARYRHALELGCSVGGLTRLLADHCTSLTSVDTSSTALQRARDNCQAKHVRFVQAHLPDGDWQDRYDLIVLSEILYYFSPADLVRLAERLRACIEPGKTDIVAVHWTGDTDYPLTGDDATELCRQHLRATLCDSQREPLYRLETWRVDA
jgi:cyclopropane fatty-acyl-phospholipid synthase-like methyltransferase